MPGCCVAFDCTNRAEKGYVMKRFPTDPYRRKLWTVRVSRKNWTPSSHSCLCEVHFSADQWEKVRVDGKKKLKCNAIPNIFSHRKIPTPQQPAAVKKLVVSTKQNSKNVCTNLLQEDANSDDYKKESNRKQRLKAKLKKALAEKRKIQNAYRKSNLSKFLKKDQMTALEMISKMIDSGEVKQLN